MYAVQNSLVLSHPRKRVYQIYITTKLHFIGHGITSNVIFIKTLCSSVSLISSDCKYETRPIFA